MTLSSLLALTCIALAFTIGGCGSKSGGGDAVATAQATSVQGIAASGNPVSGAVYLRDSSANSKSAQTTVAGEYSIDTTGLRAPFILKSVDNSNNEMFSYADAPGTIHINPLTTLAVAVAAVASGATGASLSTLYDAFSQGTVTAVSPLHVRMSTASITTSLQPLLAPYGAATVDPFTDPYRVDHQGLDDLFDKVAISISTGTVVITRKDDNTTLFDAPLGEINTGVVSTNNIPAPAPEDMPGNAVLTLKVQGVLPPGALIKNASFFIQLPLGTAPSVNCAMPIGTAAGANSYPPPTRLDNGNMVQITISSVTGFGTGAFLTISYVDSSPYSMHMRTPSDFMISNPKFYSDIYKSQELQNLTLIPDSITIP